VVIDDKSWSNDGIATCLVLVTYSWPISYTDVQINTLTTIGFVTREGYTYTKQTVVY